MKMVRFKSEVKTVMRGLVQWRERRIVNVKRRINGQLLKDKLRNVLTEKIISCVGQRR